MTGIHLGISLLLIQVGPAPAGALNCDEGGLELGYWSGRDMGPLPPALRMPRLGDDRDVN